MRKLSYNEVKEFIENIGFDLISKEYLGNNIPLILSDKEGYFYKSSYSNFKKGSIPHRFIKSNPYTIQNIELWCKLNNKPFEPISKEYINNQTLLEWKCLKDNCNSYFFSAWGAIFSGQGCGVCHGKQVSKSNCLANKFPEIAEEWHPTKNGSLTPYDVTYGSDKRVWWQCTKNPSHEWCVKITNRSSGFNCPFCAGQRPSKDYNLLVKFPELCHEWNYERNSKQPDGFTPISGALVWWKCKACNNEWKARIAGRTKKGKGCSYCSLSKGERKIIDFLKLHNIKHIEQKKYSTLLGVKYCYLSYDFYLPEYNLLIEYQGVQHEKPIDFKGLGKKYAKEQFKIQQEHDRRKRDYAQNNNIKLLEIWYYDFDNIEKILKKELNFTYKENP